MDQDQANAHEREEEALQQFLLSNRAPWSRGYRIYKRRFLADVLANETLLECFRCDGPLPPGYGVGVDERCVEYPWLLTRLRDGSGVLLDAGSTLNHGFILDHPALQRKVLHILNLAPEAQCFWKKGISYLFGDLRNICIRDSYYDTIACLSTLEHVGCDNTFFTHNALHRDDRRDDFVLAMQELARVLKPGGTLFLTVPFGVYRHFGFEQVFDQGLLSKAIAAFGQADKVIQTFYRYTSAGWDVASARECAECEYVEWIAHAWQHEQWPYSWLTGLKPTPLEPDRAAAARAVACIQLVK